MNADPIFEGNTTGLEPPRPSLWRFSLYTVMSTTAVIAVWVAYLVTLEETKRMQLQLPGLREVARELQIDDPQQYAVVRHHELSNDDYRWRIYLPPEQKYQLFLATKNVDQNHAPQKPKPGPSIATPIAPGEHELSLRYEKQTEGWIVQVSVDGQIVLEELQPPEWNLGIGSTGGSNFQGSQQQATDEPLELFDQVFSVPHPESPNSSSPRDSETGGRLWIEKLEP
ncbi:hypothetical protein [Blastopirellula marina]|uniref:Uncharacterized protein n=1 Tax=Blastopirellula marina DSM 3645 TaxID=314230 RepID=A3ZR90_9BACT|nr:hypothetical protein [Blastopirellula marina]EAQ81186.1 hypothetical protein DSM3645_21482 [Blastopirellula marina DSM 3645]